MSKPQVTINLGLRLWQREFVEYCVEHRKGETITVLSGRQRGKSYALAALLTIISIKFPRSQSFLVSVTEDQALIVASTMMNGLAKTKLAKRSKNVIEFVNGSKVIFKGAAAGVKGVQGYSVRGNGLLILDECAYLDDAVIREVLPYVNVSNASIVAVSTPWQRSGMFYDWRLAAEDQAIKHVKAFTWNLHGQYDFSEFLPEERLDEYARTLSPSDYTRLIEGEYADSELCAFPNFEEVLTLVGEAEADDLNTAGVDWSSGKGADRDYIVVTLYNSKGQMFGLYRWNNADPKETVARVAQILKDNDVKFCLHEDNSIGAVYGSYLEDALKGSGCKLEPWTTTQQSKVDLVDEMRLGIAQKRVTLLRLAELITEFSLFAAEELPSGKIRYAVPDSLGHDDVVMAAMIGYHCCNLHRKKLGRRTFMGNNNYSTY